MTSPTARTLAYLRKDSYTCQVVEVFNQYARVRIDLFGCIDIVAIKTGIPGVLGIQATSRSNMSAREKKILAIPAAKLWLETGNGLWVVGWSKMGKAGKVKHWTLAKKEIGLASFDNKG